MDSKKFYWLKLKRDFFKRHDIRIVEDMPNGKDYILFYLKMLVESVDHEGQLRFSDTIPYNEQMLATITNTNIDIVRAAMKIFTNLEMIEIIDDGTIYMSEVSKMIGSAADNDNARRQQRFRDRKKAEKPLEIGESVTNSNAGVTDDVTNDNESIEKEIEIEKELEIEKENICTPKEQKHIYGEYSHVKLKDSEYSKLVHFYGQEMTDSCITFLDEYIEMKGYKAKSHYLCIRKWVVDAVNEKSRKKGNTVADQLEQSYKMMSDWAGGD